MFWVIQWVVIYLIIITYYARKRRQRTSLKAEQFPHVPEAVFRQWKRLDVIGGDIACLLGLPLAVGLGLTANQGKGTQLAGVYVLVATAILGLPTLVVAGMLGNKAARLRKLHGIEPGKALRNRSDLLELAQSISRNNIGRAPLPIVTSGVGTSGFHSLADCPSARFWHFRQEGR